ncbi:hypothetical protein HGG73_12630 [Rhodobacteraceae bacterium R_SAG3]|nr:hypothetical protein [Rhodobacteraceae bacterium R_SAG3]
MDLNWNDAIFKVLEASDEPLHYKNIAEEIEKNEFRKSLGATPANTVNSIINTSLNQDAGTPYVRTGRGYYTLKVRSNSTTDKQSASSAQDEEKPTGLIHSSGMFWQRASVVWKSNPKILGQQLIGSEAVDFCDQIGVYLLHDRDRVIYVGRSIDRPMGQRLFEHTKDRLNGRWDRFSWFGLKGVDDSGQLLEADLVANDVNMVIATLEALLIEALEPPQNRKRGDQFSATEYLQVADPDKDKQKIQAITALISGALVDGR